MNAINAFQPQFATSQISNFGSNLGPASGPSLGFCDLMPGTVANFGALGSMDALQMMLAQMLCGQYPGFQDPSMMQDYAQNSGVSPALGYGGGGGNSSPSYGYSGSNGNAAPSYGYSGNNGNAVSYSNNASTGSVSNNGANATSSADATNQTSGYQGAPGAGQRAVDIARSYEGQPSRTIGMDNYDAPGGNTNNCAAFVTGALKTAGKIDWTESGVSNGNLREKLLADGWREIPGTETKPGDVKISASGGHTELVSEAGGTKTIGSNNVREGYQEISERDNNPNSGTYYTKDEVAEAKDVATAAEAKAAAPDATAEDKAKAETAKSDVKSAEAKADASKANTKASDAKSADAKASDSKTETKSADTKSDKSSSSTGEKSKSESSTSSSSASRESSGSKGSTGSGSAGSSKGDSGGGGSSGGTSKA